MTHGMQLGDALVSRVLELEAELDKARQDGIRAACECDALRAELDALRRHRMTVTNQTSRLPITRAMNFTDYYQQFATAFSIPKGDINAPLDRKHLIRALDHVAEEHDETMRAAAKYISSPSLENLTELADGIVDSIYVLCQAAYMFDVPLDACFAEVHKSNMRKVAADGTVKRREDGKILKPAGWAPPNLWAVLHRYSSYRAMETGSQGAENWKEAGDTEGQGF